MSGTDISPFVAQIIIEKPFASRDAAVRWMESTRWNKYGSNVHVESHLWESPGKESDRGKRQAQT
jgi:hypothetical protein